MNILRPIIGLLLIATVLNTFAHLVVSNGPSWLQGELIVIALLFGMAICVVIMNWAF